MDSEKTSSRTAPRRRTQRVVKRFEELGPPPSDPLKANEWAHRVCAVALYQVLSDPNLDERTRRAEIASISSRMAALTPMSRISRAEDVVLGRHLASETGPQMVRAVDGPQASVGSANGGSAPRRGRPRKRSPG